MRRLVLAVAVMLLIMVLMADFALAEGHFCRWYTWDDYYQGYWLYNACGAGWRWVGEIPWVDLYPWNPNGPQIF